MLKLLGLASSSEAKPGVFNVRAMPRQQATREHWDTIGRDLDARTCCVRDMGGLAASWSP